MLSDQLEQIASQREGHYNDLRNQVLEQQLRTGGYDFDKGQYEQDEHGNWQFVLRSPTGETRRFKSGKPLAAEERDAAAAAAEARQKESELAKTLAAKTKFNNDMELLKAREAAMSQRAAKLADTRNMDAMNRFKFLNDPRRQDAFNDMQKAQAEISQIDGALRTGKNPTARTGILGVFDSKELSDDQKSSLVDRKKELYNQIEQDMRQMELVRALYDMPVPSPTANNAAPPGTPGPGQPPPPPVPGAIVRPLNAPK